MYRGLAWVISFCSTTALAQDFGELPDGVEDPGTAPTQERVAIPEYKFDGVAPKPRDHRSFSMELNFRSRWVTVPKSVMDIWYFDIQDENWAYIEPRPQLSGYALGLEYVVKTDSANGIFWAEFMDSQIEAGYWDDYEEPADHLDGDFLAPSKGFGLVAFGADYAYEAHIVRTRQTQGRFGLSFLVGGGLGLAVMTGRMDRWGPDNDGNPAYKRYLDGLPPDEDKRLPPVYPIVDVNAALRWNFGDRFVIRTEGGLHSLAYFGATAGVMF